MLTAATHWCRHLASCCRSTRRHLDKTPCLSSQPLLSSLFSYTITHQLISYCCTCCTKYMLCSELYSIRRRPTAIKIVNTTVHECFCFLLWKFGLATWGADLQNILRQSHDCLTIMPMAAVAIGQRGSSPPPSFCSSPPEFLCKVIHCFKE